MMRKFLFGWLIGAAAVLQPALSPALAGPGDLLVSPVRLVFEGRARVAEVTLVNKADTKAIYRLSVENRRMKKDGSFEVIETAKDGELFAGNFIRYAPRRIALEPNAPQTIRVMVRKPPELADGEYRSHLMFAAVPDDASLNSIEEQGDDDDGISIRLTPIYGVTIPVIVRNGALGVDVAMTQTQFSRNPDGTGSISFVVERTGEKSVYGDFSVTLAGSDNVITERRGIAVYTPNKERLVEIKLDQNAMRAVAGKKIDIHFQDRTESGANVKATASMTLS